MRSMTRILLLLLSLWGLAIPVQAADDHARFYEREYSEDEHFTIELALTLLGLLDDKIDGELDDKHIKAVKQFQKETEFKPDGYLTRDQFDKLLSKSDTIMETMDHRHFRDDRQKLYYRLPLKLLTKALSLRPSTTFIGSDKVSIIVSRLPAPRVSLKEHFNKQQPRFEVSVIRTHLYADKYIIQSEEDGFLSYKTAIRMDDGDFAIMEVFIPKEKAKELRGIANFLVRFFAPSTLDKPAPENFVGKDYFSAPPQAKPKAQPKGEDTSFHEREYSREERYKIQGMLLMLGFLDDEVDSKIGPKSIAAIKKFQKSTKAEVTGSLTRDQFELLVTTGEIFSQKIGYQYFRDDELKLYYPLPLKMLQKFANVKQISVFTGSNTVFMLFNRISNPKRSIASHLEEEKKTAPNRILHSRLFRDGYIYYGVMDNMRIYKTLFELDNGDYAIMEIGLEEERAKKLNGLAKYLIRAFAPIDFSDKAPRTFVTKDHFGNNDQTARPQTKPQTKSKPEPQDPTDKPPPKTKPKPKQSKPGKKDRQKKVDKPSPSKDKLPENGSGFFITEQGHLLTTQSLIDGCKAIRVAGFGKAKLVHRDKSNNLAILKIKPGSKAPKPMVLAQSGGKLGQDVLALGYPALGFLSSANDAPSITQGVISRQSGLAGDKRFLTMSTPIQTGNKGGPLVDRQGRVVGMISSKLDVAKIANQIGDIPQNINFALKSQMIEFTLLTAGISYKEAPFQKGANMTTEQLATKLQSSVVALGCN